jgi:hypothetical protein
VPHDASNNTAFAQVDRMIVAPQVGILFVSG